MKDKDAVELTRSLLRFETVNPPGRERDCARHIGALLADWGFRVEYHEYTEARTSVIARAGGSPSKAPLCLTGHLRRAARFQCVDTRSVLGRDAGRPAVWARVV